MYHYLNQVHLLQLCDQVMQLKPNTNIPHWTQQFQSIAIGIGAILAGLGGLKILSDMLYEVKLKRKVSKLFIKYPLSSLHDTYELVDISQIPGKWWLLDDITKSRHWVRNMDTVRDMGWVGEGPKRISKKQLEVYQIRETINTREL